MKTNWYIWVLAVIYCLETLHYYGWGMPKTPDAVICDGIGFILIALSAISKHDKT